MKISALPTSAEVLLRELGLDEIDAVNYSTFRRATIAVAVPQTARPSALLQAFIERPAAPDNFDIDCPGTVVDGKCDICGPVSSEP